MLQGRPGVAGEDEMAEPRRSDAGGEDEMGEGRNQQTGSGGYRRSLLPFQTRQSASLFFPFYLPSQKIQIYYFCRESWHESSARGALRAVVPCQEFLHAVGLHVEIPLEIGSGIGFPKELGITDPVNRMPHTGKYPPVQNPIRIPQISCKPKEASASVLHKNVPNKWWNVQFPPRALAM